MQGEIVVVLFVVTGIIAVIKFVLKPLRSLIRPRPRVRYIGGRVFPKIDTYKVEFGTRPTGTALEYSEWDEIRHDAYSVIQVEFKNDAFFHGEGANAVDVKAGLTFPGLSEPELSGRWETASLPVSASDPGAAEDASITIHDGDAGRLDIANIGTDGYPYAFNKRSLLVLDGKRRDQVPERRLPKAFRVTVRLRGPDCNNRWEFEIAPKGNSFEIALRHGPS